MEERIDLGFGLLTKEQIVGFVVLVGYVVMFWTTRWRFVFRPKQYDALAKIREVRATASDECQADLLDLAERQLDMKDAIRRAAGTNSVDDREDQRENAVNDRRDYPGFSIVTFLMWNGAREIHAWRLAHEAERCGVRHWSPPEVKARLERGLRELSELPPEHQDDWRGSMQAAVARAEKSGGAAAEDGGATAVRRWRRQQPDKQPFEDARETLAQFLKELYARRDRRAEALSAWQNKVSWLVLAGAIVIAVLIGDGFGTVLGAGAVGGLLSLLQRAVRSPASHTEARTAAETELGDYGLTWALLFLAPIAGAIAAWAALLFLVALQDVQVLAVDFLATKDPLREPEPTLLAIAVVLGFSERFFQMLADRTLGATV